MRGRWTFDGRELCFCTLLWNMEMGLKAQRENDLTQIVGLERVNEANNSGQDNGQMKSYYQASADLYTLYKFYTTIRFKLYYIQNTISRHRALLRPESTLDITCRITSDSASACRRIDWVRGFYLSPCGLGFHSFG